MTCEDIQKKKLSFPSDFEFSTIIIIMPLNPNQIRSQFPLLTEEITYLDSAATAQNPQSVIDAINDFYKTYNSNVHRGLYPISDKATEAYEDARLSVQSFINAKDPSEIIFTGGCTESINLVAKSWGKANLKKGDQVVLSILEHHSNITPWQQLKEEIGIEIEWIDISEEGELDIDQLDRVLSKGKVKLVSVTGQSNVIGVRPPIKEITDKAHDAGALTLVDAAQIIAHHKVDVQDLDCDFLAFSGHKLYGPTGIGVLYGNKELLKNMPAFMTGGGMIKEVTKDSFTSTDPPEKFEAGTPPIAQAIGLKTAIEWLSQFKWKDIEEHEQGLLSFAFEELSSIERLNIIGVNGIRNPESGIRKVSGCLGFTIEGVHPHDLTDLLGEKGICMRAGHHCTQPLHDKLGIPASTRLSIGIYNNEDEIKKVRPAIEEAIKIFE